MQDSDCAMCGAPFSECARAKGTDLCLECAVAMDEMIAAEDEAEADEIKQRIFDHYEGKLEH